MKYWEIIADKLKKAGWSWAGSQRLIPTGEQSLLQTRTATTESVSLCVQMKSSARLLNLKESDESFVRVHGSQNTLIKRDGSQRSGPSV
jgi:hypothetical protein